MRIQDTYELSSSSLADGSFSWGSEYYDPSAQLSVDDCVEIGKAAYEDEDYYHVVLWLMEAEQRLRNYSNSARRIEVLDYLAYALHEQGNTARALEATKEILDLLPNHTRHSENKAFYEKIVAGSSPAAAATSELILDRLLYGHQLSDEFVDYERLCRQQPVEVSPRTYRLGCRYVTRNHPLLIYSPAKEEELSIEPRVVFYHRVLSDYDIEVIQNMSTPLLHRSGVVTNSSDTAHADYRTSQSAWLEDDSDPRVGRVARRMSAIAGLNGHTAEPMQVLNYGIGGQYEPHVDYSHESHGEVFLKGAGNRISTFLSYLTDVEAGGSTVFPKLGVAVRPQRGGALMWYNLLRSGQGDERSLHAACPVLLGYKWVANKWFHEVGNEFTRQCALDPSL